SGSLAGVALSTICRRDDPEFSNPLGAPQRPEIAAIGGISFKLPSEMSSLLELITVLNILLLIMDVSRGGHGDFFLIYRAARRGGDETRPKIPTVSEYKGTNNSIYRNFAKSLNSMPSF
ncbi:hypothetical protein OESDEN_12641, partial [Oesophagostomum dentatum]